MTAFASVDLPEPFGPISAWISPERTWRSTPLRICLSPAETCRFLISRSAMVSLRSVDFQGEACRCAGGLRREGDELGEGRALQPADDAQLHARPEQLGGAVLTLGVVRALHAAVVALLH